ncbi:MAG: ABC transporter substrate-binding protein [Stellaceae bacterium]
MYWFSAGAWRRAVLAAAVLAFGVVASTHAADRVRVGKAPGLAWTFVPIDIGIEEGLFAKYGIVVDVANLAGDAKVQQALAADRIDIGLGSGAGLAFIAKGSPAIGVAAFAGAPRNISLIVRVDAPIKTLADMKGKLVADSTTGSLSDWLARQMGITAGWGPDGIKRVPLGAIPASVAALEAKQVDGIVLATETGFQLEAQQKGRMLVSMDNFAPNFITHVVFARRAFLAAHPDAVHRFLKDFAASIPFLKGNKEKTDAIAERVIHVPPAVAEHIYDYEPRC